MMFVYYKKQANGLPRPATDSFNFLYLVLYNILIEFGILKKLVRVIKMCLNETHIKVRIVKRLSDKEWCLLGCYAVWL
jgi:hypothetical protein